MVSGPPRRGFGTFGGKPRRPVKVKIKISRRLMVVKSPRPISRAFSKPRPEGVRWFRSDGSPNWSQRLTEKQGDLEIIASRPAVTISSASTILEAAEIIAEKGVRGLPVADSLGRLKGILMATDIVNYLGGGEYYSIVLNRHKGNIYYALKNERISSIMNPSPEYVFKHNSLVDAVKLMVLSGVGLLPVLNEDGSIYGVITEHDVVKSIYEKRINRSVKDVATTVIVSVGYDDPLKRAGELMISNGFRRLPVISSENEMLGVITAKDYVSYFGSHEAFKHITSSSLEEALSIRVGELMRTGIETINEEADIGEAASKMIDKGVNYLIVVNDQDEAVGIITERDVLIALALEESGSTRS